MKETRLNFEELVNMAIADPKFYHHLKKNPAEALSKFKLVAQPRDIEALEKIDYKYLEEVATSLGYMVT